ncbi:MAG TPA: iron ABC transporter substrate-binding protein, partial [Deltaproteobacteria bacterium]|nr:iron ABC transporter substrate-binding protein [Deltaproteobacteria bacterium]
EQIIAWDPDYIVVGPLTPVGLVIDDPRWKGVKAVSDKKILPSPEGVFIWSHGSSEAFLLVMWLAKTLHPDLFRDLDVVREVRDYYRKFYHYPLTAEEARLILAHQPPK